VVGREDTGDLEAQIRGSRHAWDIRLISVDGLLRLMILKEEVEDPDTVNRIHNILFPREFTRLDEIVEIAFSAVEEAKQEAEAEEAEVDSPEKKFTPVAFHEQCVARIEKALGCTLVKRSRASFSSPDKKTAVVCAVSRTYQRGGGYGYWFAFHPHQKEFLESAERGLVAFGCGSSNTLILIPIDEFATWLEGMNTTEKENRFYWHVHISRADDQFRLNRRKDVPEIDLTSYLLTGETAA